jgi:hypothetical protein
MLFAWPLYQGALELASDTDVWSTLHEAGKNVEPLPDISPWWWLIPPVRRFLERRRIKRMIALYSKNIKEDQKDLVREFGKTATGWFYVALGGWLLALSETYDMAQDHHWSGWALFGVIVVLTAASQLNTQVRLHLGRPNQDSTHEDGIHTDDRAPQASAAPST